MSNDLARYIHVGLDAWWVSVWCEYAYNMMCAYVCLHLHFPVQKFIFYFYVFTGWYSFSQDFCFKITRGTNIWTWYMHDTCLCMFVLGFPSNHYLSSVFCFQSLVFSLALRLHCSRIRYAINIWSWDACKQRECFYVNPSAFFLSLYSLIFLWSDNFFLFHFFFFRMTRISIISFCVFRPIRHAITPSSYVSKVRIEKGSRYL